MLSVPLLPATGQLDWARLEELLAAKPRLLAIGAASNALGTITDVARAAAMARSVGALTFVDAVHYAPHELVDVARIGCDFLACSAYKFYGPHIGILFGRRSVLAGWTFPSSRPRPIRRPERMETGTQNHEGIVGAAAAVDFLASLGTGETPPGPARQLPLPACTSEAGVCCSGCGMASPPLTALRSMAPSQAYPARRRWHSPWPACRPTQVARRLADRGVFVSSGDFYATTVVARLGLSEGLVRAGCACYTTEEEVDRLIEGVRDLK